MADVTIYTTGPGCFQCKLTRERFDAAGVDYDEINIREVEAAREYVVEDLGYMQAPVVVVEDGTGEDHWSGFNPDQINRIATALRGN